MIALFAYRGGRPPRAPLATLPPPRPRPILSGDGAWAPVPPEPLSREKQKTPTRRPFALVLLVMLTALVAVSVVACAPAAGVTPKAFLSLGISPGALTGARGFLPPSIALSSIRVEGSGPSGLAVNAESAIQPGETRSFDFELKPGTWIFRSMGYNSEKLEVAVGLLTLSLSPGQRARGDLLLLPSQGSGSLSLSWSLVASLAPPLTVQGSLGTSVDSHG